LARFFDSTPRPIRLSSISERLGSTRSSAKATPVRAMTIITSSMEIAKKRSRGFMVSALP